jgi:hypothetical protein
MQWLAGMCDYAQALFTHNQNLAIAASCVRQLRKANLHDSEIQEWHEVRLRKSLMECITCEEYLYEFNYYGGSELIEDIITEVNDLENARFVLGYELGRRIRKLAKLRKSCG